MSSSLNEPVGMSGSQISPEVNSTRWRMLILGVVCMVMIANLQYGWTLFVLPLHKMHGWATADIQFSFALFIALETWVTPLDGWIADSLGPKWGPRVVMGAGGLMVAGGWGLNSIATSLPMLYAGGALTGFGAGAVYATAVGNATKWFADRRGLATGLTAAGFGAGAALTVIPIKMVLANSGVSSAFLVFGLIQGGVILIASQFIRAPFPGEAPLPNKAKAHMQSSRSHTTGEMLRTPVFWVLYMLFLLMAAGGLMASANMAAIAKSYGVSDVVILFGAGALYIGLIFANIMNGIARPLFGAVGDKIGHTNTMALSFGLGAIAYFMMLTIGTSPWGFVLSIGLIFVCWGQIFSLFPAFCTDLFGPKYATTNLSTLYTSKGAAGFLVPVASYIVAQTHTWSNVLILTACINVVAVVLVMLVLKPAEARYHRLNMEHAASPAE
ncbi:MAG: oxalate/formate MFS antiporter [Rhodospirillales bacterium]|nr:oxalate/formate MFS antiporter [Rhodospirillales bacterium]